MKNSGIEWIGDIPSDWKLPKVKNLFKIGRGRVIAVTEMNPNGKYPVFSSQTKNDGCLGYIDTYDFDQDQLTWTTDGANAGTVFLRRGKHNCTNVCGTLLPYTNDNDLRFLKYSLEYIAIFHKRADINGFKIMNNEMANIVITLPPLSEQIVIADLLDKKCAEIDTVIEKTKATIDEYKKLKQSVITQAVTKGIRPNRPMKDSGIEWIGNIPSEWSILKVKHLGWTQNGISKGGEHFGFGFPFVSYSDVYKNFELPQNVNGLINSTSEEQKNYSVEKGDIFFTRTSETIEEVGFSSVCKKTIPNAVFAGFLIRLRVTSPKIHIDYAKYYFRGEQIRIYLIKQMNLVTRASLGQDLLRAMSITIPSIDEQKEIADYLDKKCYEIDELIAKKTNLLSELESYKKSLIYEYVTGKKEVERNYE